MTSIFGKAFNVLFHVLHSCSWCLVPRFMPASVCVRGTSSSCLCFECSVYSSIRHSKNGTKCCFTHLQWLFTIWYIIFSCKASTRLHFLGSVLPFSAHYFYTTTQIDILNIKVATLPDSIKESLSSFFSYTGETLASTSTCCNIRSLSWNLREGKFGKC